MNPSAKASKPRSSWRKVGRIILRVLVGAVGFAVVAFFGIGAIAANQLSTPVRDFREPNNPGSIGLEYESVYFPASDGKAEIAAWYIPSVENTRALILVHGRDDSRTKAFAGQFIDFAAALNHAGFSVLMIDLRGHGVSSDARFSFGRFERFDVIGAVNWLKTRGFKPGKIGVYGYSLGAGSIIGAAADDPDIGAVATEAAYADIFPVTEKNWTAVSGLPLLFLTSTRWMGQLLFGYDLLGSRPVDEIVNISPRPMLMIHCTTDEMIPFSNLGELSAMYPEAETWVIEGCLHGYAYNFDSAAYDEHIIAFFDKSIK